MSLGADPRAAEAWHSGPPRSLGIFAKVFCRPSLKESFDAAREAGFRFVHLDLAMTEGLSLPPSLSPETTRGVRDALREAGVTAISIEGTYNMAHPDPGAREGGKRRLAALIEHAHALGAGLVTLCTGSRADGMWTPHPDNSSDEAWVDMRTSVADAVAVAEANDVVLAVECEYHNVVSDAGRGRRLLDEIASPALRITFDAANLVPPKLLDQQEAVLGEAFELLGEDIVVAHAKDVTREGIVVRAGAGDIDYALYLDLLAEAGFEGTLVLHGLAESEVQVALDFLGAVDLSDSSGGLTASHLDHSRHVSGEER
jgi:sugar phosphate isomerase/epimerase